LLFLFFFLPGLSSFGSSIGSKRKLPPKPWGETSLGATNAMCGLLPENTEEECPTKKFMTPVHLAFLHTITIILMRNH